MYCATTLALFDFGSSSLKAELYDANGTILESRSCVTGLGLGCGPGLSLPSAGKAQATRLACLWADEWKAKGAALHFAGTEALRHAVDGRKFLSELAKKCGASWTLISDEEEGLLGYQAWCSLNPGTWIMADLGGRSCELTTKKGTLSVKYGVLSAREALQTGIDYEQTVRTFFALLPASTAPCVVTGGSAEILSKLIAPAKLLRVCDLTDLKTSMETLTADQRQALPAIPPDWEPNLFGALACQQALALRFGPLTPTGLGWRHGLAQRLLRGK